MVTDSNFSKYDDFNYSCIESFQTTFLNSVVLEDNEEKTDEVQELIEQNNQKIGVNKMFIRCIYLKKIKIFRELL